MATFLPFPPVLLEDSSYEKAVGIVGLWLTELAVPHVDMEAGYTSWRAPQVCPPGTPEALCCTVGATGLTDTTWKGGF